jgi:dTDP-4-dehydrorhamnose reductase
MMTDELTARLPWLEAPSALEVWGGVECTINRVGNHFYNQLEQSGHLERSDDLRRFAELGIKALRYPVLWEMVAPKSIAKADWTWTDERLGLLRELGIRPIVGLVHHGSGPAYTNLLDPDFPEKLAEYACAVAERYPWVTDYTPVNEPLTTARFSGLYGHWYPHHTDAASFHRMLLNECRATGLAMGAVRTVNPQACLVQTEDLGKIYSTPTLRHQAEYENERRWLSFDLLTGRLREDSIMAKELIKLGLWKDAQRVLADPCPPDILGINYYVAGERFLDERLSRYPRHTHGGNGRDHYADLEAVRVRAEGIAGAGLLLEEAWNRYGLPIAVTEAHLGCTREEQMRWLAEVYAEAKRVGQTGADIRAVTVWSLLGAFDWNSLLTRFEGHYESGVFDVRSPKPRLTALGGLVKDLASTGDSRHPALAKAGWWRRPERLLYPPVATDCVTRVLPTTRRRTRPLLITGGAGTLGQAFAHVCERRGLEYHLVGRNDLDITDPALVAAALDTLEPWAVVNAAGFVSVNEAEQKAELCLRENVTGPTVLADAAAQREMQLLAFSSDLVFDGEKSEPYLETDPTNPLSVYGRSKAESEQSVSEVHPEALVVRTGAFFGPWDEQNMVVRALQAFAQQQTFALSDEHVLSPTYLPHLVDACLDLLLDGETGLWHLANNGQTTWANLAVQAADFANLEPLLAAPNGGAAPLPTWSVLGSTRGMLLPTLESGLDAFFRDGGARSLGALV